MAVDTNTNRTGKTPERRQFGSSLLLLLWLLILLNLFSFQGSQYPQVPYSKFIAQVEAGKVARAVVDSDRIQYVLKFEQTANQPSTQPGVPPDEVFVTTPVSPDLDLAKILREHKVEFSAPPPNNADWILTLLSWIVPPLIFFGIWSWLVSRSQVGGSAALTLGKSKARIYSEGSTGVKFDDVAVTVFSGQQSAKSESKIHTYFLLSPVFCVH